MNRRTVVVITLILLINIVMTSVCPVFAAGQADVSDALSKTLSYIHSAVSSPSYGSIGGEWAVLAYARGGKSDDAWINKYIASISDTANKTEGILHKKKYTEYSRVVLALTSIGVDASQFKTDKGSYDFVSHLLDKRDNGSFWASWQGNNGTTFALIALDSGAYLKNEEGETARKVFLDSLLSVQNVDGSWGIDASSGFSEIDMTAMVIQALAPYIKDSKVSAAVNKAIEFLSTCSEGFYGSSESCSQIVVALSALGRDAAADKDLGDVLSALFEYYLGDGKWTHVLEDSDGYEGKSVNQMATEQAAYALAAYSRFKNGQNPLYDMTDVFRASVPIAAQNEEPEIQAPVVSEEPVAEIPKDNQDDIKDENNKPEILIPENEKQDEAQKEIPPVNNQEEVVSDNQEENKKSFVLPIIVIVFIVILSVIFLLKKKKGDAAK